jgi:hypothetical protein
MKGTFRVSRFQRACDGESDVKGDVGGGGHKEYCENVEGNQGGWGTILNDLSGDDGIAEEGPEESGDCTCVQSGEDDEGGGALLEEGTGADELEGECEEVYDEESTELDTADGGFPVVTAIDEPKGDDDAEGASDDIGDVANGVF